MLDFFASGMYGRLDTLLAGWALGLCWLAGLAAVKGGTLREKAVRFWRGEEFLFGGWGGEARAEAGSWLFLIAVVALQLDTFFFNSLLRESAADVCSVFAAINDVVYCWALVLKMVLFTRYSGRQLGAGFCFFFVLRWVYLNNHVYWMILGVLFLLAAKDVRLRRTLKAALAASAVSFAAVALGSIAGWVPTLRTEDFQGSGRMRDSFGYGWYNTTGAVLLALCLMYLCWRQVKNLRWYDFGVLCAVLAFCHLGPNSRAATVCIALLLVLAVVLRFWPGIARPAAVRGLAAAVPLLAFGVSMLGSWFYDPENPVIHAIDILLGGRMRLGNEVLTQTHLAIAGQGLWNEGFIVDNYYVYLWVYGGPVASLLIWGAVALLLWRLLKKGAVTESACLLAMLAHAMMEGHFIWPCINVTLWLLPVAVYLLPQARTPDFAPLPRRKEPQAN